MKDVNVAGGPAISVLMPTFKQASFIARAIHSLRSQTCSDWELIVVADGSPDEPARSAQVLPAIRGFIIIGWPGTAGWEPR